MARYGLIRRYVELTRPQNATAAALAFSIGYFLSQQSALSGAYIIGVVIVLLLHSAVTIQNDIEDLTIDRSNNRLSGLLDKSIDIKSAQALMYLLIVLALGLAILSADRLTNSLYITISLSLAILYNSRPFYFSRRPVASILIMGICYAALPFAYGFSLNNQQVTKTVLVLGLAWFSQRISTSILKDFKDAKGDKLHRKNTFYLAYGYHRTISTSLVCSVAAYAVVIAMLFSKIDFSIVNVSLIAIVVLIAVRNIVTRLRLRNTSSEKLLAGMFRKIFFYQNQFDTAVLLCLIAF